MTIRIRPTSVDDIDAIFSIRYAPEVSESQYPRTKDDTQERWKKLLSDSPEITRGVTFRCTTVLYDDKIIGHITRHHYEFDWSFCSCGWNLAPSHWGNGLMCQALELMLTELFENDKLDYVTADCFHDNHRSIRVIEKMGFSPYFISLPERVLVWWYVRCFRWVKRYRIDADEWLGRV